MDTVKNIEQLKQQIETNNKEEEQRIAQIHEKEEQHNLLLKELKNVANDLLVELEQKKKDLQDSEGLRSELKTTIQMKITAIHETLEQAISFIKEMKDKQAIKQLQALNAIELLKKFKHYDSIEKEFRSLLFDPSGFLAHKEALDNEMLTLAKSKETIKKEIHALQMQRKKLEISVEENNHNKQQIELKIRDYEVRKESHKENRESISALLQEVKERLDYFQREKKSQQKDLQDLQKEQQSDKQELSKIQENAQKQAMRLRQLRPLLERDSKKIEKLNLQIRKSRESLEAILPQISNQERATEQVRMQLEQMKQDLYNDFQLKFEQLKKQCNPLVASSKLDYNKEMAQFQHYQKQLQALGAFNPLSIAELKKSQEALTLLEEQRNDVEEAKKNIANALQEIDQKSHKIFQQAFFDINQKFGQVFRTLFNGGHAQLKLIQPEDILNSGISIMVHPPGKKNTTIELLSGGEQSMTTIALIFAIYLVRPSPFCFLDEVDAPLDDANVKRFLAMLAEYTPNTQFLVITHNKLTMSRAEAIFGVTQEEPGVSRLVSVKLVKEQQSIA